MPKDRPDFISVRLSDHAIEQMGATATVRVNNLNMRYTFTGDTPVEILRRPEWLMLQHDQFDGKPLFQEDTAAPLASTEPAATENSSTEHTEG